MVSLFWKKYNVCAVFIAFLVIFFFFGIQSFAKDKIGYDIKIKIEGAADSVIYLANYYGDKTYLADTAYPNKKGVFRFEADTLLPGGIYIIAGQSNNKYFEILIDKEQVFSIETNVPDVIHAAKIEGSEENRLFFDYIKMTMATKQISEELAGVKKQIENDEDSLKAVNEKISQIELRFEHYKDSLAIAQQGSLLAGIINALKEIIPPDAPILENGRKDSLFAYNYYKQHYWDYFDLADERLLRTPLYHPKLVTYFTKVIYQLPDTIIAEADRVVALSKPNKETFKYVVWYLTFTFETTKVMGFDEIFVHMVDEYYSTGEAYWADSSVVNSLEKRAKALHNVLIGNQAQNLILIDTSGSFRSLYHEVAPYTIVLFYEHDCSHCLREIEELQTWYNDNEIGFEVFAVCVDTSLSKWKKFIIDQKLSWVNVNGTRSISPDYHDLYDISMTPTIFLLDEKKKILAKRIKTEQLRPFLENYNRKNKPANQ